jgi:RND family efflux transporter MFP subunit
MCLNTTSLLAIVLGTSLSLAAAAADPVPPKPAAPPKPLPQSGMPAPTAAAMAPRPVSGQTGNAGKKLGDDMECMLEPRLIANLGSPVEGTLGEILVDRGSTVSKGQVLARLNSNVEAATVTLKKAQADFGERKVKRNEELFKKELISASEKDEMETQTKIAELELRQQQEVLNQRVIRSPINGVVVDRFLSPGDRVANEKILRLAQIDPLNVEVIAPLEMFGSVKIGMAGEVRLAPLLPGVHKAKVVVVDRVIDAASGTFGVRLELPNPGNNIPSGIKCKVRFAPG